MAEFTIGHDNLKNFLSSLGKDLSDIVITLSEDGITASVGKDTHYIRRQMDCGVTQTGRIVISDLPKFKSFLATIKGGDITVTQSGRTGTLHVACGKASLQLPTSSYVQSQDKVGLMERLIKQSEDNMWQTWHQMSLDYHAKVDSEALKPAAKFGKVLGEKYSCKTEFDPQGREFVIRGGKASTGKMFVKASLNDIDSPEIPARSAFDRWLPELLNNLPSGEMNLYTGDETVLVLEQPATKFLMVVIDQEYEED